MLTQALVHFPTFLHTYTLLKESQWWSKEQLEEYQLLQLKKLLNHAYENVPYYTKIFKKLKLKPKEIQSINDLQKLPYLTKEIVRKNLDTLKATNYPEHKFQFFSTGGSTGRPLRFYIDKGVWSSQLAAYGKILMDLTGRSYFDRCVLIVRSETPFEYRSFRRTLVLSSFFINDKYLPLFIKKIRKLKPKYFLGYPSAITNLAVYMRRNNLEGFPSVKIIMCHAETLYEWQRDLLEEMFQCRVYNRYGLRETAALGSTCEHSNYLHMFPEYGIVELIGKEGKPVKKEGEVGEIVGTGFHTYIFPFIRYKTGDLGIYTTKKCPCGRNYPLLKRIEGRVQEFVVSKTKQLISLIGVYGLVAMCSPNVKECQLYQDTEGEIILNIVKTLDYSDADSKIIKKRFQARFGDECTVKIQFVDSISYTKSGKYRFLVQKLPLKFGICQM